MSMYSCVYLEKKHEWGLLNFIVPSTFKAMQSKLSLTMGLHNALGKTDDKHMQSFSLTVEFNVPKQHSAAGRLRINSGF